MKLLNQNKMGKTDHIFWNICPQDQTNTPQTPTSTLISTTQIHCKHKQQMNNGSFHTFLNQLLWSWTLKMDITTTVTDFLYMTGSLPAADCQMCQILHGMEGGVGMWGGWHICTSGSRQMWPPTFSRSSGKHKNITHIWNLTTVNVKVSRVVPSPGTT